MYNAASLATDTVPENKGRELTDGQTGEARIAALQPVKTAAH